VFTFKLVRFRKQMTHFREELTCLPRALARRKAAVVLLIPCRSDPWTPFRTTRPHHALPLYTLRVATPETAVPFQEWPLAGRAVRGSLTTTLDTPCHTGLTSDRS
jgi:hypothetical protein